MAAVEALLAGHRTQLQRVIALAEQGGRDKVTQYLLDGLAGRARSYLRRIEATLKRPVFHPTHGDLGLWGENGLAPTIRSIVRSAEFHASYVPMEITERPNGSARVAA
jgi:hypothetical protein